MLPLRDVIPSRTFPLVTVAPSAAIALGWIYELTLSPRELALVLRGWGVVPADLSWPTMVSAMFLHGSWSQALINVWFLWIFGENVEDRMGHGRFLGFFLVCGAVAALGYVWLDPGATAPGIGATGAVGGVIGAYLVLYPQSRVLALVPVPFDIIEIPALVLFAVWCLMQLISVGVLAAAPLSPQSGIAFLAHMAGVLVGVVGVFVFRRRRSSSAQWT